MPHAVRTSRSALVLLLTLVAIGLAPHVAAQGVIGLPLFVQNDTDVARVQEPVASGIAIPRNSTIHDPNVDLTIYDDQGQIVPAQFKVLSRWDGMRHQGAHQVRWVLVEFLADVAPNTFRVYGLAYGPRAEGQVSVQDSPSALTVSTGAATFAIDKIDPSLFQSVQVQGQDVLGAPIALDLTDVVGTGIDAAITSTVVEEGGSVRTVVRRKGNFPGMNLEFTIRYYFWSGRSDVRVEFRLENGGGYGYLPDTGSIGTAWFDELALTVSLGQAGDVVTTTGDAGNAGAFWSLEQDYATPSSSLDMLSGFRVARNGPAGLSVTSERYPGAVALNGATRAVAVSIDRFWQNYPKAFRCVNDTLTVGLWPAFGRGPSYTGQYGGATSANIDALAVDNFRFEGGRWKTVTLDFDFATTGFAPADVAARAKRTEKPLMALLPIQWTPRTLAMGHPIIDRRDWSETSNQRYEQHVQILADDTAATNIPNIGKVGMPAFRNRGGTYGGGQFFGWQNFGDLVWGDGYCSNHYDLPWSILVNYYRTGDYAFFDVGRDVIAHRRDYDQLHSTGNVLRAGGQSYEKGWTHGNYQAPTPSHTWLHGLLLWYVMTGDEGAYEAALEGADFIVAQHPENWSGLWGSRIIGWQIEGLINLYNYVGDPAYKNLAKQAIQRWETLELQNGGQGYVLNQGSTPVPQAQSWMHAIVYSAIGKYYLATLDPTVLPVMQRGAGYFQNHAIQTMPTGPWNARTTAKIWGIFDGTTPSQPSAHYQWPVLEALTWMALCLHDNQYMAMAREIWESSTRYHQSSGSDAGAFDYGNPSTFHAVGFRLFQYPNSESKVVSNIALWGHTFLALDAFWDGNF